MGDRAQQADAERTSGELELAAGNFPAARSSFERSLALAKGLGQRRREAQALDGLGRLARAEGKLDAALGFFDAALVALESERVHVPGAEAQTSFSALAAGLSEGGIEAALALDRAHPGAGWGNQALARVERSRGRALVELLAQAGVDLEAAVDPARAARRSELSRRLAAKAERASGSKSEAIRTQLAREAAEIGTDLDLLDDAGDATGFASYRVTLTDAAGKKLYAADALHPNALEVILLTFPRDFFAAGEYRLRLEGRRADRRYEEVEGYRFRVVRD